MSKFFKKSLSKNIGIIFLVSLILVLPQTISGKMIIGSDALFHFNRFFDTAQQIEQQDFQFFISVYGFQQTGRIVTPLYSQIFSYLFGLILLLCQSWYKFQIITNFLLFLTAGLSLYFLLRKMVIREQLARNFSLIYMTTYAVSYWVIRQGYSSWGAALLPLCLIPLVDLIKEQRFRPLPIAFSMAVMFQLHFLSSVFLVILYLFAYLYCFSKRGNKQRLLLQLLFSVVIFLLLTANVWYSLGTIYSENQLVQPFINRGIYNQTITSSSWYWLINPFILPIIILLVLLLSFKKFKNFSPLNKFFTLSFVFFTVLSSNFFPWKFLYEMDFVMVQTVQFPFRFFVPATICLLSGLALSISEDQLTWLKKYQKLAPVVIGLCISHSLILYTVTLSDWDNEDASFINSGQHVFLATDDFQQIKDSFYRDDLSLSLALVEKSTPDYLPLYSTEKKNNYDLYEEYILFNEKQFSKQVKDGQLIVQWTSGTNDEEVIVPVIKYQQTKLIFNNQELTAALLTEIGNPIVKSQLGENTLILSY